MHEVYHWNQTVKRPDKQVYCVLQVNTAQFAPGSQSCCFYAATALSFAISYTGKSLFNGNPVSNSQTSFLLKTSFLTLKNIKLTL